MVVVIFIVVGMILIGLGVNVWLMMFVGIGLMFVVIWFFGKLFLSEEFDEL